LVNQPISVTHSESITEALNADMNRAGKQSAKRKIEQTAEEVFLF
jgi:hypothetical protein